MLQNSDYVVEKFLCWKNEVFFSCFRFDLDFDMNIKIVDN